MCAFALQHYQLFMILMPYLLVDATDGWTKDKAHSFILSSCMLFNSTKLHYKCASNYDEKDEMHVPVTVDNLNTFEVSENLCGSYNNHHGINSHSYIATYLFIIM